jgi:hypothetical protein
MQKKMPAENIRLNCQCTRGLACRYPGAESTYIGDKREKIAGPAWGRLQRAGRHYDPKDETGTVSRVYSGTGMVHRTYFASSAYMRSRKLTRSK